MDMTYLARESPGLRLNANIVPYKADNADIKITLVIIHCLVKKLRFVKI